MTVRRRHAATVCRSASLKIAPKTCIKHHLVSGSPGFSEPLSGSLLIARQRSKGQTSDDLAERQIQARPAFFEKTPHRPIVSWADESQLASPLHDGPFQRRLHEG
jgi:hypothetical protein